MICHFERHEKSHDEEKPFVCHLCNKTFKYVENNQLFMQWLSSFRLECQLISSC